MGMVDSNKSSNLSKWLYRKKYAKEKGWKILTIDLYITMSYWKGNCFLQINYIQMYLLLRCNMNDRNFHFRKIIQSDGKIWKWNFSAMTIFSNKHTHSYACVISLFIDSCESYFLNPCIKAFGKGGCQVAIYFTLPRVTAQNMLIPYAPVSTPTFRLSSRTPNCLSMLLSSGRRFTWLNWTTFVEWWNGRNSENHLEVIGTNLCFVLGINPVYISALLSFSTQLSSCKSNL